eukprot:CAMPEP_0175261054 /NCGR_PEP_ID=MMETSP0093-20121207/40564_1 /TAXON_ID=311494 /ORGANISM="Alexandrium monilatum, Strain CCMP3105" /LENGTH=71 /DNA_ID=CAMNT_0016555505 /DNA_START=13 /DNA_END=225 /DNA_ORIENTATION=+
MRRPSPGAARERPGPCEPRSARPREPSREEAVLRAPRSMPARGGANPNALLGGGPQGPRRCTPVRSQASTT